MSSKWELMLSMRHYIDNINKDDTLIEKVVYSPQSRQILINGCKYGDLPLLYGDLQSILDFITRRVPFPAYVFFSFKSLNNLYNMLKTRLPK